jgi:hypothetical protein
MIVCPVCGYPSLPEGVFNHGICPSCGTEFGYDDIACSHEILRSGWLLHGGEWFDKLVGPPAGWNAIQQVIAAFPTVRFVAKTARKPITSEFQLDLPLTPLSCGSLRVAG